MRKADKYYTTWKVVIFISIVVIAFILRVYKLGNIPPSLDWDEAALGYNAYSILKTGKDEYGVRFPLILRSFDDYKPSLYVYLLIPFIYLVGLTEYVVRIPSMLFGTLSVIASFFLTFELLASYPRSKRLCISYIVMFLMAISPWHLQFSRIAFEANIGLSFNILALLFFLLGYRKNKKYFYISSLFFALAPYVYQSEKLYVPLMGVVLVTIFFKTIRQKWREYIGPLILFFIFIFPFYYSTFTTENALLRAKGVSVFADQTPFLSQSASRLIRDKENNDYLGLILDNRRITYLKAFFQGYLAHYDINWLFLESDHPRHHAPNMGNMYVIELLFLFFGIYTLYFSKLDKKIKLFLTLWIIIVPIPASLTTGVPHSIRSIHFLPVNLIFVGVGIYNLFMFFSRKKIQKILFIFILIILYTVNIAYYLDMYYVQYPIQDSKYWQYGYKEAVEKVRSIEPYYNKIIVSNKAPMDQSYIFFLFYLKYDPEKYLAEGGTRSGGFKEERNTFGKYEFRPIHWENEQGKGYLYIGVPSEISSHAHIISTIRYLDGSPAILLAEKS